MRPIFVAVDVVSSRTRLLLAEMTSTDRREVTRITDKRRRRSVEVGEGIVFVGPIMILMRVFDEISGEQEALGFSNPFQIETKL